MPPDREPGPADVTIVPASPSEIPVDPSRLVPPPTASETTGSHLPVIAGYAIESELGRGGMGVVYRALQLSLNRPVALKMILAGFQAGERDRTRFRSEAKAVARLQHPNIVQIHEVGEQGGRPYLALELVEGSTLQQKLAGVPQPIAPTAHLVELVARAIHHAHQCGIVHRDLKPGNVLLATRADGASNTSAPHASQCAAVYGLPKITDFGLAKRLEDNDQQTRSGDLLGTPSYMAPEQADGRSNAVGPGADVYALGAILYEMLTGRPPFRGATALETLHQVLHDEPVPPGQLRPKLPKDLERICLKCLEKEPRKRYESALDLADDLRRHLNGESVHARPAPAHERVWRWCRRNPIPAGLLVVATLGSAFGLWYLSWLTRSVVHSTALQGAAQQAETLDELNKYYGRVAAHATGRKMDRGWEESPGAIPIPATMTIELGEQITARSETGTKVRLYSDFPFKSRTDGGPRDDFERDALTELRHSPGQPFYRFEELDGRPVLRYATARQMAASCVTCHNNHPDSTKTDWKEGDVRGVLEVIRPLDRDQERVSQGLRGTALLIAGVGTGGLGLSLLTLVVGNRRRRPPPGNPDWPPDEPRSNPPAPPAGTAPPPGAAPSRPDSGGPPMPEPRNPDPAEPTLVPGSMSVPPSVAPADTAHPAAHEVTLKPPPPPPAAPIPQPSSSASMTDADATRAPVSGVGASSAPSAVDATQVPATSRTGTPDRTVSNGMPAAPPSAGTTGTRVGRFALKGLHARGGLGEVFTARDTELNREVAIKRIQSRYADDPSSRRRFLSEAEITARLDHPGVVPVFGLVADGLGRPCYAMRFIRGETLKDEIERYHGHASGTRSQDTEKTAAASPEPGPAAPSAEASVAVQPRSVAFRHLLQRFIAVCQAIAYAHTRKVIHRDIKPANVMVGTFGETLVVDWGLAKALDAGPAPEQLLKAMAATDHRRDPEATELPDDLTMAGTAVGTPAYMAPEQASGRIDLIGPTADVYSLGATLFAILTGKAPFSGNATETLDKVRRGEFPTPREINEDVPAPLDAVCRKAMSLRIEDRYVTALDLATDVERWLSDEPVSCYRDPFPARLARWARRHPARVAAGMSLLVAGVLATIVIAWAINDGRRKTQTALEKVTEEEKKTADERDRVTREQGRTQAALELVTQQKAKTEEQHRAAQAARDVARDRYDAAVKAFNTLVVDVQRQLADRSGTQDLRRILLVKAQEGLQGLLKGSGAERIGADRTLVAAHRQMGDVYQLLGNTREARKEHEEAVHVAIDVLIKAQERRSAADEWEAKRDLGRSCVRLADVNLQAGHTAAAKRACETALDLFQQALDGHPDDRDAREDLAAARDQYSDVLMERGEVGPATEQCRVALEARRKLAEGRKDDVDATRRLADSLGQCAEIMLRSGRTLDARKHAEECLAIRTEVSEKLEEQPDVRRELAAAHGRLGEVTFDRNDLTAARKEFEAARDVLVELLGDDPRSAGAKAALAVTHGRLAATALRRGDLDVALQEATTSNKLCKEVDRADPDSTRTTRDLAQSHERLGDVLLARGRASDALAAYRQSAEILGPIEQNDPDSFLAKLELAHALERVGEGQLATGNPHAAVSTLTDSIVLREKVLGVDRGSARAKQELAVGLGWLSDAYRAAGRLIPARAAVTQEVTLLHQVVDADKDNNGPARRELATATGKWGEVLAATGKPTTALMTVSQSLDQFRALAEADKGNAHARADVAAAWERLAGLYADLGQTEPAMAAARAALTLRTELAKQAGDSRTTRRELAISTTRVADVYAAIHQFDLARQWYESASQLIAPDAADARTTAAAERIKKKLELLDAVDTIVKNPGDPLAGVPTDLQVPALRAATEWLVKGKQTVTAGAIAWQLAVRAITPEDRYAAALALARCATAIGVTDEARAGYAEDAVKALALAVAAGFRDAEALRGPEWEPCRGLAGFQKVIQSIATARPIAPAPRTVNTPHVLKPGGFLG